MDGIELEADDYTALFKRSWEGFREANPEHPLAKTSLADYAGVIGHFVLTSWLRSLQSKTAP